MKNPNKSDKVFEDILDDNFVNVFRSNFYIQSFFGTLGINIKYKFVTPPTKQYKVYSVIFWLFNLACVAYSVTYCGTKFNSLSTDIPIKIGVVINVITNATMAWKSAFTGETKSQIYVKLQRIERILKIKDASRMNAKRHRISVFMCITAVILIAMWLVVLNKYLISNFCPCASVSSVACTASYFIIFHICSVIRFISDRVQYVNDALTNVKVNGTKVGIVYSTTGTVLGKNNLRVGKELVYGMSCILESFADTMDEFQHAVRSKFKMYVGKVGRNSST